EIQKKRDQGGVLPADLPIVLLPCGQRRKGGPQMALCIAVKAALTAKALPLPEQRQGHHLTPAEGCLGARVEVGGQRALAKVIDHHVQSSQEGVHIDHRMLLILGKIEQFYRPGRLPFIRQVSTHTKRLSHLRLRRSMSWMEQGSHLATGRRTR